MSVIQGVASKVLFTLGEEEGFQCLFSLPLYDLGGYGHFIAFSYMSDKSNY